MTLQLKILSVIIGASLFVYIIELVKKRKLREEYAWGWLVTGFLVVMLSLWYDLLQMVGDFLGGIMPSAVLFFFGLIFLLVIMLQMSVRISSLSDQVKNLAQEFSILNKKKQ